MPIDAKRHFQRMNPKHVLEHVTPDLMLASSSYRLRNPAISFRKHRANGVWPLRNESKGTSGFELQRAVGCSRHATASSTPHSAAA